MFKILFKAAILLLIVISVYLIVHPTACSNMLAGRESIHPDRGTAVEWRHPMAEQTPQIQPASTTPAATSAAEEEMFAPQPVAPVKGVADTRSLQEPAGKAYSQQDIDYAIASRYVELEREYARNHTVGKDTSREISFIVMDDFEMSPAEWESFLSRATAADLFEKVRKELPPAVAGSAK